MPQVDEPITPAPKAAPETKRPKSTATPERAAAGVYSFTIDTGSNRIVMVERVDSDGNRHPLTAEEKTKLAKAPPAMPLRRLVERAPSIHTVNLGGIHHRAGRAERLRYIYLTSDEERELRALESRGIDVTAQDVPSARPLPLRDLLDGSARS